MKKRIGVLILLILTVSIKIANAQIIYTIAGTGVPGYNGDGISATSAQLNYPTAMAMDTAGNMYIADQINFRIRKVSPSGVITTIAGTGVYGYGGDNGLATNAMITGVYDICLDRFGNVYIADNANQMVRKISTTGIITRVAGTPGPGGYNGDNIPATTAKLNSPGGVAVDNEGNIYIGDGSNNRVRKVDTAGVITTIAGTGVAGSLGDNGLATAAQFYSNGRLMFDKFGNLFIADNGNRKVRKIDLSGIITTVAGTGSGGSTGDNGPATSATFTYPFGVCVDTTGNFYIADYSNRRVRKVNTSGIITTYAGTGSSGYFGDGGLATSAFVSPQGVNTDKYGNLLIADLGNHCIRKVVNNCIAPNPPTSATASLDACYGETKLLSVSDPGLIKWYATPTAGTVLGTGFNFTTPLLYADTVFYAATTTCATSATRTSFPITVRPVPTVTSSNDTTICHGSTVMLNGIGATNYTWTGGVIDSVSFSPISTATYTVTGTNAFGCSATASTTITVNTPNPTFTASGNTLTANASGAGYQWFDCTSNTNIGGATSQAFTTTSGDYALIITQNGCVDTSSCYALVNIGIENNDSGLFNIYPNPFSAQTTLVFAEEQKNTTIEITNVLGTAVKSINFTGKQLIMEKDEMKAGIYFVQITDEQKHVSNRKIIIQ